MSVRPLRPDTDRSLGEPLPHQLANQARAPLQALGSCESPALISAFPKAGCHAVLAFLSKRYPPLEGRSPTRYSPVCHSTNPLRDFRVRLACVRHAASVDSEPGSNSHVKFAVPTEAGSNCLTRLPVDLALALSVLVFYERFAAAQPPESGDRAACAVR